MTQGRVLVGGSRGTIVQRRFIGPPAGIGLSHTAQQGAAVHDAFRPFPRPKMTQGGVHAPNEGTLPSHPWRMLNPVPACPVTLVLACRA